MRMNLTAATLVKGVLTAAAVLLIVDMSWAGFYVIPSGPRAKSTIVVSPGATPEASGQALLDAMASIDDNSYDKPYLIKVEPGVYDIGSSTLIMKEFVHVEGSGQNITTIQGNVLSSNTGTRMGIILGVQWSEIRNISITNKGSTGSSLDAIGISCVKPFTIRNVSIVSSNGRSVYGIFNGFNFNYLNKTIVEGCKIETFGCEFYCTSVYNDNNSKIYVNQSEMISHNSDNSGSVNGFYNYYDGYVELSDSKIKVYGGDMNVGVYISGGSQVSKIISGLDIRVDDPGNTHYGIFYGGYSNQVAGEVNVLDTVIRSVGDGIYCQSKTSLNVANSLVQGSYASIETKNDATANIGLSKLEGAIYRTGSPLANINCFGCYDQNMAGVACP